MGFLRRGGALLGNTGVGKTLGMSVSAKPVGG